MKLSIFYIFFIFLSLITFKAQAQDNILLTSSSKQYYLGSSGYYIEDPSGQMSAAEIIQNVKDKKLSLNKLVDSSFGYTKSVIWRWTVVENKDFENSDIGIMLFDLVSTRTSLYIYDNLDADSVPLTLNPSEVQNTGSQVAHADRPTGHKEFIFRFKMNPGEKKLLLFRHQNHQLSETNGFLSSFNNIGHYTDQSNFGYSLYFGIMLAMFIYNLFLFAITRDKDFQYYLLWLFGIGILFWGGLGFGDKYTPIQIGWSEILPALRPFSLLTATIFVMNYIKTNKYVPKGRYVFYVLMFIQSLLILMAIGPYKDFSGMGFDLILAVTFVTFNIFAILCWRKGSRQVIFFFCSWIPLILSIWIWYLVTRGLVPQSPITLAIVPIGNSLEMLILALGLADRIRTLQHRLVATLEDAKLQLEKRVRERTHELEEEIVRRERAQNDLASSQQIHVNNSKMVSIGHMATGVAHEINNPLTILSLNNKILETILKDKKDLDDTFKKSITEILNKANISVKRIENVVTGLRSLSSDESRDPVAPVKVKDIINNVLAVTSERFKSVGIDFVHNEVADNIVVSAHKGAIGQIILNLLNNANDAVEKVDKKQIKLLVTTRDNQIFVKVQDSGRGLVDVDKASIFEPFVTTKLEKKAVGLGLTISYQMAKAHNGDLRYVHEDNMTTFILSLPIAHLS